MDTKKPNFLKRIRTKLWIMAKKYNKTIIDRFKKKDSEVNDKNI
jgi:hypothetical protein